MRTPIRKRGFRRKREVLDFDMTSLLDILVILLVFLLKSYNSSGVTINVPQGISLPKSESVELNKYGVIIQVSSTKIWVDDKLILDLNNKSKAFNYDHAGRRIIPLYNTLIQKKELFKRIEKSSNQAKKFSGIANLLIDKSIKYSYTKKILYTCAEAGFGKYKFVVLSKNQ